jgi:hypothetical protein
MYAMILTNLSVALSNQVIYPLGHEKEVSVSSIFEFNDVNLKKGIYFLSIKSSFGSTNKQVIIN